MLLRSKTLRLCRQVHNSSFVIIKATECERKEILRMMQDIFFKTDPTSIYSKVSEIPYVSQVMQDMALEALDDNLSFVAKEKYSDKKIFGAAINGIRPVVVQSNYMDHNIRKLKRKSEKTLLEFWSFLSSMPQDAQKYFEDEEKVFEVKYLVVDPAHQSKGVGTSLVTSSKKEASDCGMKYMRIDCTSGFTARIASSIGLNCIYQIDYEDYRDPSGEHVFRNVTFPHIKAHVYAGKSVC